MGRAHSAASAATIIAAAMLSLWLTACGGGSDSGSTSAPAMPQSLSVSAPATQQAPNASITFASSADDPNHQFSYQWDFGDGSTSAQPSPTHAFARPGAYTVHLTIGNGSSTLSSTRVVNVADLAIVQGEVCSGADHTGWCWQRPLPQGNAITSYSFVDDRHGWAVGQGGTVLSTRDGGATWQGQFSGTSLDLYKVLFVDLQVGWVAGADGEILRTVDGGSTWQRLSFGVSEAPQTLGASDANTAWVTDNQGSAYFTVDGGLSWQQVIGPSGFTSLTVLSHSDIWAAGYSNSVATLAHSVDGGVTWASVSLPPLEAGLYRYATSFQVGDPGYVLFLGSEYGYSSISQSYVSRQAAWTTSDGGATWQVFTPNANVPYANYQFVGATTIVAFSQSYPASLVQTVDNGTTWQPIALPTSSVYFYGGSLQAYSSQRWIARDYLGQAFLTLDGGAHWKDLKADPSPGASSVNSVWFFSAREGLAIADDGSSLRTTDGGQSWVTETPSSYSGWRRLQFLADGSAGWAISNTGTIYLSANKGKTWLSPVTQSSAPLYGVNDFHFIDAQHGWAVSPYNYSSSPSGFYRTSDGGLSWQAVASASNLSGFSALRFADALHGVVVGPPGVAMVSSNGGATWAPRPTGVGFSLRRVTFADANIAVAVGDNGAIVRSTDRGQNWTALPSPTPNSLSDVRFVSAQTGYAVGDAGTLLVTHDGGLTWVLQSTSVRANMKAVFFVDEQTGWMAGDNGSMLATVNGGR